jgi:RNA polymerase sigma-32 factor
MKQNTAEKLSISVSSNATEKNLQTQNQLALFKYMQEVNSYKLLDTKETKKLIKRYQDKDDQQAGDELITANLRLVVKIAGDFQKYWTTNFLDLVQEGNIGLIKAISKFEP